MPKYFIGHIFTNHLTKEKTLFEHINKDGQINYYPCQMKIPDGKYRVKIKNNIVVACWKYRNKSKIKAIDIKRAFEKLDRIFPK